MKPFSDVQMKDWGYAAWRSLPDGTVLAVAEMLHENGRLYIDVHADGYGDFYCYDGFQRAVDAMNAFDPEREQEPSGWKRHFSSGRRRPNGDQSREFVSM